MTAKSPGLGITLLLCIGCIVTTGAGLYQHSVADHLRSKAHAYDQRCRYVNNALRIVQLDLGNKALRDGAVARIGRDAGVTFEEINTCTSDDTDRSFAALAECQGRGDVACMDTELTKIRATIRDVAQR